MAKDPAFLFYFQDFAFGTRRLTRREKGAYLDLLIEQADLFSKDEKYKMTLSHVQLVLSSDFDVWEKIKEKFEEKNGFFWNKKLEEVQNSRRNFSLSRKNNRLGKTKNKQVKNTSYSSDKLVENENVIENEIINKVLNLISSEIPEATGTNQVTTPILFSKLDSFISDYPTFQDIEIWKQYLAKIMDSDFLMGRGDEVKQPSLAVSWICDPKNAMDVMDGKYINRKKSGKSAALQAWELVYSAIGKYGVRHYSKHLDCDRAKKALHAIGGGSAIGNATQYTLSKVKTQFIDAFMEAAA